MHFNLNQRHLWKSIGEKNATYISIRGRIKYTEIQKKTGVRDIIRTIKINEWARHNAWRNDNRWTTRVMD